MSICERQGFQKLLSELGLDVDLHRGHQGPHVAHTMSHTSMGRTPLFERFISAISRAYRPGVGSRTTSQPLKVLKGCSLQAGTTSEPATPFLRAHMANKFKTSGEEQKRAEGLSEVQGFTITIIIFVIMMIIS